jgi:ABC-type iron transport system FetAB permease component
MAMLSYNWQCCLTTGNAVLQLAMLSYNWQCCLTTGNAVLQLAMLSYRLWKWKGSVGQPLMIESLNINLKVT